MWLGGFKARFVFVVAARLNIVSSGSSGYKAQLVFVAAIAKFVVVPSISRGSNLYLDKTRPGFLLKCEKMLFFGVLIDFLLQILVKRVYNGN
jgi:hypothetical protein